MFRLHAASNGKLNASRALRSELIARSIDPKRSMQQADEVF
ncbi:hypothetical protein ACE0DR_17345 [Azotobacter sp. CWF10]